MARGLFGRLEGELEAREKAPGLSMADVLALPEPLGRLCAWILRRGNVTLADAAASLAMPEPDVALLLADLRERGFLREIDVGGALHYQVRLARKRGKKLPASLWQAIEDKVGE